MRHELLAALERDRPGIKERLWSAAQAAASLQEQLEAAARRLPPERAALSAAPRPVRLEAYRQLFAQAGGRLPGLSRRQLEAIDALVVSGRTGAGVDLPGGHRLRLERSAVSIASSASQASSRPATPALLTRSCRGCDDSRAAHLREGMTLSVGYRTPGLRMRPLRSWSGHNGSRKLQDILTDAGVPRHLRDSLPLVFADGRLAWVPSVAVDADLACRPGEAGTHVSLSDPAKEGG